MPGSKNLGSYSSAKTCHKIRRLQTRVGSEKDSFTSHISIHVPPSTVPVQTKPEANRLLIAQHFTHPRASETVYGLK